jgi:hypothetical protein
MRRIGLVVAVAAAATACSYDLDATVRPGGDGPLTDPCGSLDRMPDQIRFQGTTKDGVDAHVIPDVRVDLTPGGVGFSDAAGGFDIGVSTGGDPLRAAVAFTDVPGYPPHRMYFQRPFDEPTADASVTLHSYAQLDQSLYGMSGDPPRDPDESTIIEIAADCSDARISGVTFTLNPAPEETVFFGGTDRTGDLGVAYALNVSPGPVDIAITGSPGFTIDVPGGAVVIVWLVRP